MFGETKIVIRWTDVRDLEEVPSLIFPDSVRIFTCDNNKVNYSTNLINLSLLKPSSYFIVDYSLISR